MADHSEARSKHATLSAATVDSVTLTTNFSHVEVKNRATTGAGISFTTDGSTPTALGDDTYWVGPGEWLVVPFGGATDVVKLISATADAYSVTGVEP